MSTSNFQSIRLLDPGCGYKVTCLMTNSADPDQLASSESEPSVLNGVILSNWRFSTLLPPSPHLLTLHQCNPNNFYDRNSQHQFFHKPLLLPNTLLVGFPDPLTLSMLWESSADNKLVIFLAHLSRSDKVSFCDHIFSIMHLSICA